jgi:predicted MFS family arabinose efflux permease
VLLRGNSWGWSSGIAVTLYVVAAVLLVGFYFIERVQKEPMLDFSLFRVPTFTGAQIVAFAISSAMFAQFLYLTLYLQNVLGLSPIQAGLRFLPLSLVSFFVAPISGRLSTRVPVRFLLGGGLALVGLALVLMHGVTPSSDWTTLLPGFIVGGIGIGMVNPPLASTAVSVVPPQHAGMASGVNNTFRQVGIATGIAGLGAIFQDTIKSNLHGAGSAEAVASGAVQQGGEIARAAFIAGLNEILLVGAIVAFTGAVLGFLLVRGRDFVASGPSAPGH